MAEDVFGNVLGDEADDPGEEEAVDDSPPEEADAESQEEQTEEQETLAGDARGEPPTDPGEAYKYWQGAYTKSRQKDREKYGTMESELSQYKQVMAKFYQDEAYARQVIAQRFPDLAKQMGGQGQGATPPQDTAQAKGDLTAELQQSLDQAGGYGWLAPAIGSVLERRIEQEVQRRTAPLEQRATQQTELQRRQQEDALLADMDGKYPGWEQSVGAQMRELDEFLGSDHLTHPKYGSKYEMYYRLLNPDQARIDAAKEMQQAARRRTTLGRTGRGSVPNIEEQVRKAETNADAFRIAAKLAEDSA